MFIVNLLIHHMIHYCLTDARIYNLTIITLYDNMSSDTKYEDGAFALDPDDAALHDVIDINEIDMNDQENW